MNPPPSRPPGKTGAFGSGAPTIHDVAKAAGVSIGTVSKALNDQGRLREETRVLVRETAARLGFRPNDLAQALHRGKSLTVGMISSDSFGRFTMPIMEGLEGYLAGEGISVFMCNATDDPERERLHIEQLLGKRVDGLVFTSRRADRRPTADMTHLGVPTLFVYAQSHDPMAACLLPDDQQGARDGVLHLARLGRKRIAHVTGPDRFEAVVLRQTGYLQALQQSGIDNYHMLLNGPWLETWGHDAVAQLFDHGGERPDAVFCGNDQIARGVIDALRERRIAVPGDVAVVGFDNWDVMTMATRPALTSVDMNLRGMGKEAGVRLMAMIRGETFTGITRLPCSLAVRQSCGATSAT
ncbi:LacI family DNA-binding transcriptional regulator [Devosia sp.]|uniref:LacI family DNA-binding transcriptional regulator n=1 Tax=Devosia sp. TaxID=1871048 RepID=UPI00326719E5